MVSLGVPRRRSDKLVKLHAGSWNREGSGQPENDCSRRSQMRALFLPFSKGLNGLLSAPGSELQSAQSLGPGQAPRGCAMRPTGTSGRCRCRLNPTQT